MKRQIRRGVFETNSSSIHSLVISKEGRMKSRLKLNEEGKIVVNFGHFGKDYNIYKNQKDKLSYLITCLYYLCGYDVESIYDSFEFECIQRAVCKYTGATGIIIGTKIKPDIDHESIPYTNIEIINAYDEDEVIDFVFNKYVALKTDCD